VLYFACHRTETPKGGAILEKNLELSGMIHAKYPNESAMAKSMGWTRQKLNKITTGRKMPDLQETKEIASALDKSITDVANIFLKSKSPNCDK
jgi:DNA-binding XRE family transcriptional regulator